MMRYSFLLLILLFCLQACEAPPGSELSLTIVDPPTESGSLAPNFATSPDGDILLSWLQAGEASSQLQFSRWEDGVWSSAKTIAAGDDWFVNWADFPAMLALDDERLLAHWLVRNGDSAYAYDIHLAQSTDAGSSWAYLGTAHDDGTASEHGFLAFYPYQGAAGQRLGGMVWLDGRAMTGHHGDGGMTLRHARLDAQGRLFAEQELDQLTCDCCQTAAVALGDEVLVAYRDRSEAEIRDIRLLRGRDGNWHDAGLIQEDDWFIEGCPVNGPAMAADGQRVIIAWFSGAGGRPVVKTGLSLNGGQDFLISELDDERPLGRVAVTFWEDRYVVAWLAGGEAGGQLRLQVFNLQGQALTARVPVLAADSSRNSGFPKLAASGEHLLMAWTDVQNGARRVRAGLVRLTSQ